MRYFWLLDGEAQWLIWFYYQPGQDNLRDYPSKHHTADIHQHVCPFYTHMHNSPSFLPWAAKPSSWPGCVETLADPYKGRIPLPSVPNYRDQDLFHHLIQTGTNTPPNGQKSFLNRKRMKLSSPTIVTERNLPRHHPSCMEQKPHWDNVVDNEWLCWCCGLLRMRGKSVKKTILHFYGKWWCHPVPFFM